MRYRRLGNSDLEVSDISLGSWLTYGVGVDTENAQACVDRAFDLGINFIDTANIYGRGRAESFLGDALKGRDRSTYILATKAFWPMTETDKGLSREQIHKQIDASLRRLQTDYVDLYQCHRYDHDTPLEETMQALTEVVEAGKARYIGFSEWTPEQIRSSFEIADTTDFVSSQPQYSMLWRTPEKEVFPLCAELGIGQIVWSPLAQGVLTGKYEPGRPPPADSRAASESMGGMMGNFFSERTLERVQSLRPIADKAGLSMAQLALAWVLRDERVSSAIIGASKPQQVEDNAAASEVVLDDDTLMAIDDALEGVVEYDAFIG
ncbi:MAG: aldo/keto reductase family protein [Actinomycetota bacterium]|nr:aldo/keto reductase family protein [Actinomycetota bacterium]